MDHHAPTTNRTVRTTCSWRAILALGLVAAALVQPVACLFARLDWRADLLTHFPEPALVVTLIAFIAVVRRRPRLAIGLALVAVWQAAPLISLGRPNPIAPDPSSPARLRVLMANVLWDNAHHELLSHLIERERPDVVGLVECTPEWIEGLADVRREFPYRAEAPEESKGMALWFRERPLSMEPPRRPIAGGWPYLRATFDFAGRERRIWIIHPGPPHERRNLPELAAIARDVANEGGSRIVVGDLNSTDGSPSFGDFLAATGLRDSRVGFGRQASFPEWSPYRIAIDHAFVSDDLAVVARRLGPSIGSDHFPLILDLAPAPASGSSSRAISESQVKSSSDSGR